MSCNPPNTVAQQYSMYLVPGEKIIITIIIIIMIIIIIIIIK